MASESRSSMAAIRPRHICSSATHPPVDHTVPDANRGQARHQRAKIAIGTIDASHLTIKPRLTHLPVMILQLGKQTGQQVGMMLRQNIPKVWNATHGPDQTHIIF